MNKKLFLIFFIITNSLFVINSFAQTGGERYAVKESFQKATSVWIDSKNVWDEKKGRYYITTSGRHETRQAEQNLTASFRSKINITDTDNIKLRLTASSDYRAYVNGQFLGHGPCVAAHGYYRVDEYDLKDYLKRGENFIAIEVAGYNVLKYYLLDQPAFLQAEITDNGQVLSYTHTRGEKNELFEGTMLDQRIKDVPHYSFQRPHIESYKLKPDYNKWMTSDNENNYAPLKLERTATKNLISRRVKYPDYSMRYHTKQLSDSMYQFECNSTGFIGLKVNAKKKSKITLSWDEIIKEDGNIDPERMRTLNYIYYELEPGEYTLESFEPYTLQYLKVTVNEGDCTFNDPYIRQYVNSDVSRATFVSNDDKLNKIFKAAVETYKQNALDVYMDCPQRERAGWLCDSYFTGRVEFNLTGRTLIETNFLENYILPERFDFIPEGMIPMCYPSDHANANYIPNWTMWYVLELEEYFKRSNDYLMIANSYDRVMGLIKFFEQYENEDSLLEGLEKWVFVEWSKANSFVQDVNYPTNMLYARMLEITSSLYNKPELYTKAQKIKQKIKEQSYDGKFFIDNAIRVNGKLVPQKENRTETCQYYAFHLGTATVKEYPELWKILTKEFGPKRAELKLYEEIYPSNAFIGNYLRLEVLSQNGMVKQLLNESVDNFLYMAELTGTLWENIHTRASVNHGFASHIAHVFYRDLLGLKTVDLLNKTIILQFNESDIKSCKGTIPLHDDLISIEWEKRGNRFYYSYSVPKGYEVIVKNNTKLNIVMKQ